MAFRGRRKLTFGDIVKFGAALLAALGLDRVVSFVEKRRTMSDQGKNQGDAATDGEESQQPRDQNPADSDEVRRLNAATDATSDIAEERRRHSDVDDALEQKIALGYETEDARVRPIVTVAIVSAIFLALVALGLYGFFKYYLLARPFEQREPASALNAPTTLPPEPRLQVDPPADWQALQATEEAQLSSYGWADRKSGAVRIPIDRAMDLLIQRGLPVRSGSTRQFGADQQSLDSSGGQYNSAAPPPNAAPFPTGAAPTPPAGTPQSGATGGPP